MELTMRAATPAERLYAADQSMQIEGQTGSIGHLRLDKTADGQGFSRTWKDHRRDLASEEFRQEFENVLTALASDEQYGGFLNDRDAMAAFCLEHPESSFNDGFAFGFRADTAQYSYMIRLNPCRGEENLFIYCYRRDWLDSHMKNTEKGIRFITPHYKEKFRIEDGDKVQIRRSDGTSIDRVCRYIDDCHVEIGHDLYHICEFAERLERSGGTAIPLRSSLPERCFAALEAAGEVVVITRGEMGYRPTEQRTQGVSPQEDVDRLNEMIGVTKAQAAAMKAGSLFGWDTPAADPKNYNEQGQPVKPRYRDRGDAR